MPGCWGDIFIFLLLSLGTFAHMPWGGYKKFAVTIRVNNICRPDDPDAWVLPGPGTPGEDAIFQCVKGIFLLLPLGTFAHMLWDSYIKFAITIRVNNLCRLDDLDAWVPPRPGALMMLSVCQGDIFIFLLLPLATFGQMLWDSYKKICRDS